MMESRAADAVDRGATVDGKGGDMESASDTEDRGSTVDGKGGLREVYVQTVIRRVYQILLKEQTYE